MFAVLQANATNARAIEVTDPAMNRGFTTALLPLLGTGSQYRPPADGVFHLH